METITTDLEKLSSAASRLHNGQSFELPDLEHPLVVVKRAIEADGQIRVVVIGRLELHVTLLVDHEWATPEERLEAIKQAQAEAHADASMLGLDQAFAEVPERWALRLKDLGWEPAKGKLIYLRID